MDVARRSAVPEPAPHELRRERLLEVLHAQRGRPLLLLVAPAGFGKSTLAAAYARESGATVVWHTLGADDRDARVLFERLADGIERAFGTDSPAAALRRELREGVEGVGLARALAEDLSEAPSGLIVVLDDFHLVQAAEHVHDALDALLRDLPEGVQLVITARDPPALSMTRLVAAEAVFALGVGDLRFTPEETRALRSALGGDASRDADAEGWVAGILLGGAPRQLGLGGGTFLLAYVEREVLARLRPAEQRWLEALSVVETITPAAAERLLGRAQWGVRLAGLAERCPFLVATADGAYRLHGLVREALVHRLRRASAQRAARAWNTARRLAEEAGDTAGVVHACRELGDEAAALEVVRRMVGGAMERGRWSVALATLDLLPESARRADAEVSLWEAHALVQSGRPEPARAAAEAALQLAAKREDAGTQISAILEVANIARYEGDLDAAEDWLSAANHLLLRTDLPPRRRRLLEGRAGGLLGVCLAVRGRAREARQAFEAAEHALHSMDTSRELALVHQNLGTLCSRTGAYAEARGLLSAAAREWRTIGDRQALATTQTLLGNLSLRTGDLDAAGAALTSALESARSAGTLRLEAHATVSLASWHRASGRIAEAVAAFDAGLRLAEVVGERELLVEVLCRRAEVALLQDDSQDARMLLARAQTEAQCLGSEFQLAGVERALGRLHLAEGAIQRGLGHLLASVQRGASAWGPFERSTALYWVGTAHLALGGPRQAEDALREALSLCEAAGDPAVVAGLATAAAEDPRLLQLGMAVGLQADVLAAVRRLAEERQAWTGVSHSSAIQIVARNDFPRLEARLLGSFVLYLNGCLMEVGARRVDRAREFLALLLLHPAGIADREVATRMWPEMAPERALHNLQMAAYLLRRLLGSKASVRYVTGAYSLAPQMEVWADTREFGTALGSARRAAGEAAEQALQRAVDLYRGPLLADATWNWVVELRSAYQAQFVAAAQHLAGLLAASDPQRSDAILEQILELEPDNEAAHEQVIRNASQRRDGRALHAAVRRYRQVVDRMGLPANPRLLKEAL